MNDSFKLGRKLLNYVLGADDSHDDVARLDTLHQRTVVVRPPGVFDHGAAVSAGKLGNVQRFVARVRVSEEGHFNGVCGARKEAFASAGEVAGIGTFNGRKRLMHAVFNEVASVAASGSASISSDVVFPGWRIGYELQIGG